MAWTDGKFCECTDRGYCQVRPLVRNIKDGSVMVLVPGGEFEMGDGEKGSCPKHRVWVDAFYIGVYCVTNRQYARFMKETGQLAPNKLAWGSKPKWKKGKCAKELLDHPVVCVSWDDAMAYAKWAGCELPTEAQWEKVARGPKGLIYPWGDEWDERNCRNANNRGASGTAVVWGYGEGASGYGTYQQSGNVWEWCLDWYRGKSYAKAEALKNPTEPATGKSRRIRGGCWRDDDASCFRGTRRKWIPPANDYCDFLGFRPVRAV